MHLPIGGQIAVSATPTALKFLNEGLNPSQPSDYEQRLKKFMELYEGQAESPVTENRVYQSGKREIDAADKKNREQISNVVGAGNVTNEVKLAGMDDANDTYASALNRLMQNAQRFKEFSQGKVIQTAGALDSAKRRRLADRRRNTAMWLNPLSNATNAFLKGDALGDTDTKVDGTDEVNGFDMDPLGYIGGQ